MKITISDHFGLGKTQEELPFFNADLTADSMLYLDPFLLKRSSIPEEYSLFKRFEDYFGIVLSHLLELKLSGDEESIKELVYFKEPKSLNLGYTSSGNGGKGPGKAFGEAMLNFLRTGLVSKVINFELYGTEGFNPNTLRIFVDKLGPDGMGDFSASIIMDYLIGYTQNQCAIYEIELKSLPSPKIFDFDEGEWYDKYEKLPENPLRKGEPIIFIPKHLLRYMNENFELNIKSGIIGFLRQDEGLKAKFSKILSQPIKDIPNDEIRKILYSEEEVMKKMISNMEEMDLLPYDFSLDKLEFTSIEKGRKIVENCKVETKPIINGDDLFNLLKDFLRFLETEYVGRDGWKNAWKSTDKHNDEPTFGRIIRSVGNAYFEKYKEVKFIHEQGSGYGFLDFSLIYKDTHISIELKNLGNKSIKGASKLPSYLHGIKIQLPEYIKNNDSNYGVYFTLQHYDKDKTNIDEINAEVDSIIEELKEHNKDFKDLLYFNLDLTQKPSPSNK